MLWVFLRKKLQVIITNVFSNNMLILSYLGALSHGEEMAL